LTKQKLDALNTIPSSKLGTDAIWSDTGNPEQAIKIESQVEDFERDVGSSPIANIKTGKQLFQKREPVLGSKPRDDASHDQDAAEVLKVVASDEKKVEQKEVKVVPYSGSLEEMQAAVSEQEQVEEKHSVKYFEESKVLMDEIKELRSVRDSMKNEVSQLQNNVSVVKKELQEEVEKV